MPDFPSDQTPSGDLSSETLFADSGAGAGPGTTPDGVAVQGERHTYHVLARKYRPRRFEDLIGQEAMVRTLANSFKSGRIAHAFMLTGVRGVGKTTTARLLARALTYESATIKGPSLVLDPPGLHCASIIAGAHPDILEMDAASHTGVANMRDILDRSAFAPAELRKKIYIIDEVHMLSVAAFNSLLKTLEEPPAHVAFIFATTEIRKVPVTILSRCQRFDLRRVPVPQLAAHLGRIAAIEGAMLEPDALALLARAAEGSVRDGLSLLDQAIVHTGNGSVAGVESVREMLGLADRGRLIDLFRLSLSNDIARALAELEDLYALGAEPVQILRDLLEICHAASKLRVLGPDALDATDAPADRKAELLALAGATSAATLGRLWQILLKGMEECQRAPDALAAAEMCLMRLAAAAHLPGPEEAAILLRRAAEGGGMANDGRKDQAGSGSGPVSASGQAAGQGLAQPEIPARMASVSPSQRRGPDRTLPHAGAPAAGPATGRPHAGPKEGQTTAAPAIGDAGFVNLVSLLEQARELTLAVELEDFALGGRVTGLDVAFSLAPGAPRDLLRRLAAALAEATGESWRISLDPEARGETLAAIRNREREAELARIRAHPAIAAMLGQFPELRITSVSGPAVPPADPDMTGPMEETDTEEEEDPEDTESAALLRTGDGGAHHVPAAGSQAPVPAPSTEIPESSAKIIALHNRRKSAKG